MYAALVTIAYDTEVFDVTNGDVDLGDLVGDLTGTEEWTLTPNVDDPAGSMTVLAYSATPLADGPGDLLAIDYSIREDAPAGSTPLDLVQEQSYLNGGELTLSTVDGSVHVPATLSGDLNGDGFVGGDDLDIVRSHWGQYVTPGSLLSGDPSGDGFVGGDDLDIVRCCWGQGTPPAPAAPAMVEEETVTTSSSSPQVEALVKADSDAEADAHDAVFAQTTELLSNPLERSLMRVAMARQLEEARGNEESSAKKDRATEQAVDRILQQYDV